MFNAKVDLNPIDTEVVERAVNKALNESGLTSYVLATLPRIQRLENIVQQLLLLEGLKAEEVPEKVIPAHVILTPIPRKEKPTTNA